MLEHWKAFYYMGVKLVLSPETAEKDLHVNQWEPYDLPHNEEGLVVVNGKVITAEDSIRHLLAYLDKDGLKCVTFKYPDYHCSWLYLQDCQGTRY